MSTTGGENETARPYVAEITNRYNALRYCSAVTEEEAREWIQQNYVEHDKQAVIWFEGKRISIS
jgi:hypothetical protein